MHRKKIRKKPREKVCSGGFPWLSKKQMKKLRPFFPKSRGKPRGDDQRVERFLGDKGCDANWIRNFLKSMGITLCIPERDLRKKPIRYDKKLYKQRNKIERVFCAIKD